MDDELMHELSAAFALDALDAEDERAFEEHLSRCASCREDVAQFTALATSLAYGVPPDAPSPDLRERVLAGARAERLETTAPRPRRLRRPVFQFAGAAAALAAIAAAALIVADREGNTGSVRALKLHGAAGSVVVADNGSAVLTVDRLRAAPPGTTYEAWVMRRGHSPIAAGLFAGGGTTRLRMTHNVEPGSVVGVTLERAGGSSAPSGRRVVTSDAA